MSEKALIFNLVNGSFVDGYGVRTTIFLKGCPLRCTWCCNPEGQTFVPQLNYLDADCNDCNGKYRCVDKCRNGAISPAPDGKIRIDRAACTDCGDCCEVCYFDALSMMGTEMSTEDILEKLLREKPFFERSGGGLTIGGGEATCFPAFCLELIGLCHENGIPVAIDTCGYMTKPDSIQVLYQADLILLDIKGLDEQEHIRNTGVSNAGIWETLRLLNEAGKPVIIRVPMIPNYNFHKDRYPEMARKLAEYPVIERVDLLPFHEYGKGKYQSLGMVYQTQSQKVSPEDQAEIKAIFADAGFNVQIGG